MRDQRIRDPVHDLIKFSGSDGIDAILWQLVQTYPFQRLRRIKQLGFSDFVYPGASHSRFSHSLGAMQMARRMLDALERNNQLSDETGDRVLARSATLCAALLHDIGHGPYSHVFEDMSSNLGVHLDHETYTAQIIESPPVTDILEQIPGLLEATRSFFTEEPGNTPYSKIVSSQLDADRLDFLVRDRYFTGVRFGSIDLDWILDNLVLERLAVDVESEVEEYTFAFKSKGLPTLEDYLLSYLHMYSQVYFHKTTRAVQFMVSDILGDLLGDDKRKQLPPKDPLVRFFDSDPEDKLDCYLALDDSAVLSLIRFAASNDLGESSILATRFLNRDLYKTFEPPSKPDADVSVQKVVAFRSAVSANGISFHQDVIPAKSYKQFEIVADDYLKNILVFSEDDQNFVPVSDRSPLIRNLPRQFTLRYHFQTGPERDAARKIWTRL